MAHGSPPLQGVSKKGGYPQRYLDILPAVRPCTDISERLFGEPLVIGLSDLYFLAKALEEPLNYRSKKAMHEFRPPKCNKCNITQLPNQNS